MKSLSSYLVQGLAVVSVVAIVLSAGVDWWEKSIHMDTQGRALGAQPCARCPRCTGRFYEGSEFFFCLDCKLRILKWDSILTVLPPE